MWMAMSHILHHVYSWVNWFSTSWIQKAPLLTYIFQNVNCFQIQESGCKMNKISFGEKSFCTLTQVFESFSKFQLKSLALRVYDPSVTWLSNGMLATEANQSDTIYRYSVDYSFITNVKSYPSVSLWTVKHCKSIKLFTITGSCLSSLIQLEHPPVGRNVKDPYTDNLLSFRFVSTIIVWVPCSLP